MKASLRLLPYLLVNAVAFYLAPLLIQDTGSAMLVMLIGTPVICFVTAIAFGAKNSFNLIYPLAVALLFVPAIFIVYNKSATIYVLVYGTVALVGNLIGKLFHKPK